MESDKRYFLEGLFIIVISIAAALAFVWLNNVGHRDDVTYRIHFNESVSGLALGDPVKFQGVDVGNVKAMRLDPEDPNRVIVDLRLRKEAPVKTDTKASLKWKGITGVVYVELNGGGPDANRLADATPAGQIPEIPSEKSEIAALLEKLPKVIDGFAALEKKGQKVLSDVGDVTSKVKEDPSSLLRRPKKGADEK
jgi:phospholipid/cholesterol/gamma-HCH transport system substrate-binding protein